MGQVRIGQAHRDSMFEFPHLTSIGIAIALSRRNRWSERANKPEALSASSSAERERRRRSREVLEVLLADKTPPCPNKLGPYLSPNGPTCRQQSLVGALATLVVARWRTCH